MDVDRSYIDQLNSITQRLEARTAKEQRQCVAEIVNLVEMIGQAGATPADTLGQHVSSNVMVLVTDHFVKPALQHGGLGAGGKKAAPANARQDITRPLRSLVEALHKGVPADGISPPFAFRSARPLQYLLRHTLEVLNADGLVSRFGVDYAQLFVILTDFAAYAEAVASSYVGELVERLVVLMSVPQQLEAEEIKAYARALARAVALPQWAASMTTDAERMTAMSHIALLLDRHLGREGDVTSIPGHTALLEAASVMVRVVAVENPDIAVPDHLAAALRKAVDVWHTTKRKDSWRSNLLELAGTVVAVLFRPASEGHRVPVAHYRLLHQALFPWAVAILDAPRWEFGGAVSGDDLWRFRSSELARIVAPIAAIIGHVVGTADAFAAALASADEANGNLPEQAPKRNRASQPSELLFARCTSIAAAEPLSESHGLWLHALGVRVCSSAVEPTTRARIAELLAQKVRSVTPAQEQPVLGALVPFVRDGVLSESQLRSLWALTVHRAMPSSAVDDMSLIESPSAARTCFLAAVARIMPPSGPALALPYGRAFRRMDPGSLLLLNALAGSPNEATRRSFAEACTANAPTLVTELVGFALRVPSFVHNARSNTAAVDHGHICQILAVALGAAVSVRDARQASADVFQADAPTFLETAHAEASLVLATPHQAASGPAGTSAGDDIVASEHAWDLLLHAVEQHLATSKQPRSTACAVGIIVDLVQRAPCGQLMGRGQTDDNGGGDDDDSDVEVIAPHQPSKAGVAAAEPLSRRVEALLARLSGIVGIAVASANTSPSETGAIFSVLRWSFGTHGAWQCLLASSVLSRDAKQPLLDALGGLGRRCIEGFSRLAQRSHTDRAVDEDEDGGVAVRQATGTAAHCIAQLISAFDAARVREFAADPLVDWPSFASAVRDVATEAKLIAPNGDAALPAITVIAPFAQAVPETLTSLALAPATSRTTWELLAHLVTAADTRFSVGATATLLSVYDVVARKAPRDSSIRNRCAAVAAQLLHQPLDAQDDVASMFRSVGPLAQRPPATPPLKVKAARVLEHVLDDCDTDTLRELQPSILKLAVAAHFKTRAAGGMLCSALVASANTRQSEAAPMPVPLNDLYRTLKPAVASSSSAVCLTAAFALRNVALVADGRFCSGVLSAVAQFAATRGMRHRAALMTGMASLAHAVAHRSGHASGGPEGSTPGATTPGNDGGVALVSSAMFRRCLPSIAFDWVVKLGHQLDAFPGWLLGAESFAGLLSANGPAAAHPMQEAAGLYLALSLVAANMPEPHPNAARSHEQVLDALKGDLASPPGRNSGAAHGADAGQAALIRHFTRVVAVCLVLQSCSRGESETIEAHARYAQGARQALEAVRFDVGSARMDELLVAHADDIVVGILRHAEPELREIVAGASAADALPHLPHIPFAQAAAAVDQLCQLLSRASGTQKSSFASAGSFFADAQGDRVRNVVSALACDAAIVDPLDAPRVRRCAAALTMRWVIPNRDAVCEHTLAAVIPVLARSCALYAVIHDRKNEAKVFATVLEHLWEAATKTLGVAALRFLPVLTGPLFAGNAVASCLQLRETLEAIANVTASLPGAQWQSTNMRLLTASAAANAAANVGPAASPSLLHPLQSLGSQLELDAGPGLGEGDGPDPQTAEVLELLVRLPAQPVSTASARLLSDAADLVDRRHVAVERALTAKEDARVRLAAATVPWLFSVVQQDSSVAMATRRGALSLLRAVAVALLRAGHPPAFLDVIDCAGVPWQADVLAATSAEQCIAAAHGSVLAALTAVADAPDTPVFSHAAARSLRRVLTLPAVAEALGTIKAHHPQLYARLMPFRRNAGRADAQQPIANADPWFRMDAGEKGRAAAAAGNARHGGLDDAGTWSIDGSTTPNEWICRVARAALPTLAGAIGDEIEDLVLDRIPAVGAAVFHAALLAMAVGPASTSKRAAAIRAFIGERVEALLADATTPSAVVRLLVAALAGLQALHVGVVKEAGVRAATAVAAGAKPRATSTSWVANQPATLLECLGFAVDPVVAATAAHRVGEHYHAHGFLEMASDRGAKGLVPVSRPFEFGFAIDGATGVGAGDTRSRRHQEREAAAREALNVLRGRVASVLRPLADALGLSDVTQMDIGGGGAAMASSSLRGGAGAAALVCGDEAWAATGVPLTRGAVDAASNTHRALCSAGAPVSAGRGVASLVEVVAPIAKKDGVDPQALAQLSELAHEAAWRCMQWDAPTEELMAAAAPIAHAHSHSGAALDAQPFDTHGALQGLPVAPAAPVEPLWQRLQRTAAQLTEARGFHGHIVAAVTHCCSGNRADMRSSARKALSVAVDTANSSGVLSTVLAAQMCADIIAMPLAQTKRGGSVTSAPRWACNRIDGLRASQVSHVEALRAVLTRCVSASGAPAWARFERADISRSLRKDADTAREALRVIATPHVDLAAVAAGSVTALSDCDQAELLAFAKAHWAVGEQHGAINILRQIPSPSPRVALQTTLWMRETEFVPASAVVKPEWLPRLVDAGGASASRAQIHLASIADDLFRALSERLQSAEVAGYRDALNAAKSAHDELRRNLQANESRLNDTEKRQIISRINATEREFRREDEEKTRSAVDGATYRHTAMLAFARYLANYAGAATTASTAKHSERAAFRLLALWFSPIVTTIATRCQQAARAAGGATTAPSSDAMPADVADVLDRIPAHALLPIMPQLVVRLGTAAIDAASEAALVKTVTRVASAHPQACVWMLLALANGSRFADGEKTVHTSDPRKIQAAAGVLKTLRHNAAVAPVLEQQFKLAEAYLELAFQPADRKAKSFRLGPHAKLVGIRGFKHVVNPTGRPGCPDTVHEFRQGFELVGGVNAPKVLHLTTSGGKEVRQLVKSRDDLRQDAIIEQFFNVCNSRLAVDRAARSRGLGIRTYKVIPLAPTSGLVEWVDETVTFADYLVNGPGGGAHGRWYPADLPNDECREALQKVPHTSAAARTTAFKEVCESFTPAMHFFFPEHYASAEEAFRRRAQYTRSAAACSILGYLVGLGDRHASNALIDKSTGDIVQIDLGLAFEQGAALPVPERIPFRLTRDVVDGLGMLGAEGPFRFHCEAALAAMRSARPLLATVLEAFLHDPLAKWAVVVPDGSAAPGPATQAGRHSRGGVPAAHQQHQGTADAERALARARDKLRGYEGGEQLGVAGHVRKLVQRATDDTTLAQLFPGWSPWM